MPDAEELARQLDALEAQVNGSRLGLSAVARLREQAATLADRVAWLSQPDSRNPLAERVRKCLQQLE